MEWRGGGGISNREDEGGAPKKKDLSEFVHHEKNVDKAERVDPYKILEDINDLVRWALPTGIF